MRIVDPNLLVVEDLSVQPLSPSKLYKILAISSRLIFRLLCSESLHFSVFKLRFETTSYF